MRALSTASLSFVASDRVSENVSRISAGIQRAADQGARVLLVPECSLVGYPSAARGTLLGLDWCEVGDSEDRLALEAERRDLVLILGTVGKIDDGSEKAAANHYTNEALVCGAIESVRYRKQTLTPTDSKHFSPGISTVVVTIDDWRCGIAICFDLRFSDPWLTMADAGADAFLVIAHMAGPDPDPGTKAAIIPALCAVRAAETVTPLVMCNTSASDRYLDSGAWDARGVRVGSCAEGMLMTTLTHREALDPWYETLRRMALERWHLPR